MPTPSANKELALAFLDAFSVGDFEQVLAMLDDDATWWANGTVPGISGRRTKQQFADAIAEMAGLSVSGGLPTIVSASLADGDRVAVEARSDATFTNGKTYQNDYVFLFHIKDDKIIEVKEYMDPELARSTFAAP
jgi:ketosteroid isomerase-like protein